MFSVCFLAEWQAHHMDLYLYACKVPFLRISMPRHLVSLFFFLLKTERSSLSRFLSNISRWILKQIPYRWGLPFCLRYVWGHTVGVTLCSSVTSPSYLSKVNFSLFEWRGKNTMTVKVFNNSSFVQLTSPLYLCKS